MSWMTLQAQLKNCGDWLTSRLAEMLLSRWRGLMRSSAAKANPKTPGRPTRLSLREMSCSRSGSVRNVFGHSTRFYQCYERDQMPLGHCSFRCERRSR